MDRIHLYPDLIVGALLVIVPPIVPCIFQEIDE